MWRKTPKRHCDATDKDDKWRLERKLRKKLSGSTTMVFHKLTVSATNHFPDGPGLPRRGFAGGLICNNKDKWVIGMSIRLVNNTNTRDYSVSFYSALLDVLQLAWSRGFRCLDIKLGFVFHDDFWTDFSKDVVSKKLRLCVYPCSNRASRRTMIILKLVEDYLNRDWFINVKNTESIEEEAGALTVSALGECQELPKRVYDYRTDPLPPDTITRDVVRVGREIARSTFDQFPQGRKYFGLD
ncbi:hypothetical protein SOVF_119040 isoform B [Spinacia oleracea]|uniref:RNase H type-1 domain-containing protein n=1 Tax=Spinacia oleracea TaxID=3562 RepID=A0ABM3R5I9_SPIOL|nr:uncharacterized protein LOC130466204 [Spinacia oleracea]KNA13189.1 hypothetical protein SOVF_119040 isoform B [Spinacia oleracea]